MRAETAYVAIRPSTCVQLTVPLSSPRGILGAIVLESDGPTAFDDQDLALVTLFGQQATIVLERAVLHEQLMRQSRLDRDMDIARDILKSLNPESAPMFTGMDVFGRSVTAETVGGDAFDFIPYPESQLGISISDAKGKGLPGALLAVAHHAMIHALVSMELRLRSSLAGSAISWRCRCHSETSSPRFTGSSTSPSGASFTSMQDIRLRSSFERMGIPKSFRHGATARISTVLSIREAYATFDAGDGLVLYTDGITEAGPSPDEFFEVAGVQACVGELWSRRAPDVCQGLFDEAARRSGGAFVDDATVVVVKFNEPHRQRDDDLELLYSPRVK